MMPLAACSWRTTTTPGRCRVSGTTRPSGGRRPRKCSRCSTRRRAGRCSSTRGKSSAWRISLGRGASKSTRTSRRSTFGTSCVLPFFLALLFWSMMDGCSHPLQRAGEATEARRAIERRGRHVRRPRRFSAQGAGPQPHAVPGEYKPRKKKRTKEVLFFLALRTSWKLTTFLCGSSRSGTPARTPGSHTEARPGCA